MPISINGYGLFLLSLLTLLSVSSSSLYPSPSPSPSLSPVFYNHESYNHRPDPFSSFKSYHGGYNISNSHYWASAAFIGIHGYAMACILILGGLGFGIYLLVTKNLNCCTSSDIAIRSEHSNSYYIIPFLVIVLCTSIVITSSGCVLGANHKSLLRTKKMENTIFRVATDAHVTIRRVTKAMQDMRTLLRPYNGAVYDQLGLASHKLASESQMIRQVVGRLRRSINKANKIWQVLRLPCLYFI
ncbi:transmembrane protein [Thalictrum thalictroides]|uniref:Transmembrane protein n=1 Tax=Thalictrum thalictroides TaxID=46969 RepID=A0A7J6X371_THATH|nr:transmembrane protein [Thalictrum thalictroides]